MATIGINGFGRIGRLFFRAMVEQDLLTSGYKVAAVNDLVAADNLAYLLKYDSTQGKFNGTVVSEKSSPSVAEDDTLIVNGAVGPTAYGLHVSKTGLVAVTPAINGGTYTASASVSQIAVLLDGGAAPTFNKVSMSGAGAGAILPASTVALPS